MQPGNQTVTFVVLSPVLGQQGSRGDGRAGECSVLERRASGLPVPVSRWCRRAGRGYSNGCSRPHCDAAGHGSFRSRIRACEEGVQR